jgi:hypothetical protein
MSAGSISETDVTMSEQSQRNGAGKRTNSSPHRAYDWSFRKRSARGLLIVSALVVAALLTHFGSESSTTTGPSTDQSGSGNRPPVVKSAKILNDPLTLTESVAVKIDAEDLEREAVSFRYQWYVNDVVMAGQTGSTLPADLLRRGHTVSVEITPTDGSRKGQPYRTAAVLVGNTPPRVIRVSLTPQIAQSGDRLEAQVDTSDLDHDLVTLSYRWLKNNAVVKEGEEPFLDTTGLAVRDEIVVEVTARDSISAGSSLRSDPVILGNSAPKIVSNPPAPGPSDHYEYAVKAVDLDGDRLTYQLTTAPPGMTISEESGRINWQFPSDQQGIVHVKVVAKDGQGGIAYQEFDLTFTAPVPAKPAGI